MDYKIIPFVWIVLATGFSCSNDPAETTKNFESFSGALTNKELLIITADHRTIKAYLSKPQGTHMDIVLALHGGTANLESSVDATKNYNDKPDGGKQFLDNGYAVLSLGYSEYENDGSKSDRGFKELTDVLAATDYILNDSLTKYDMTIDKTIAFGHSRGGNNALLAGIERPLHAVVAAEAPLDWAKTRDSIRAGVIPGSFDEIQKFEESVAKWTNDDFIKYSPGLRLEAFQSPFLIISGELDPAVLISIAEDVREDYLACNANGQCMDGGLFIFHERGHTDWAQTPGIMQEIQEFIK
ncbi:MAG: alpha/beta hydrolase family protein [Flavobacteriaceae bacterium]